MIYRCKPKNLEEWVMIKMVAEKLGHVVFRAYNDVKTYGKYPDLVMRPRGNKFRVVGDNGSWGGYVTPSKFLHILGHTDVQPIHHIKKHTV